MQLIIVITYLDLYCNSADNIPLNFHFVLLGRKVAFSDNSMYIYRKFIGT